MPPVAIEGTPGNPKSYTAYTFTVQHPFRTIGVLNSVRAFGVQGPGVGVQVVVESSLGLLVEGTMANTLMGLDPTWTLDLRLRSSTIRAKT